MGTTIADVVVEVMFTRTGIVEKPVGTLALVMVFVWSVDSVLDSDFAKNGGSGKSARPLELVVISLTGTTEKPVGIFTPVMVFVSEADSVSDPYCDFLDSDWVLENGDGSGMDTRALELVVVFLTGKTEKIGSSKFVLLFVCTLDSVLDPSCD